MNKLQQLKELDYEIAHRQRVLYDMAMDAARYQNFPGTLIALRGDSDKIGRYQRLTQYLHENDYPWADVLWVGVAVVSQMEKWKFFWMTRTVAAQWFLKDPKKLSQWLLDQGLVERKAAEGKESYKLHATPKLLTILDGSAPIKAL